MAIREAQKGRAGSRTLATGLFCVVLADTCAAKEPQRGPIKKSCLPPCYPSLTSSDFYLELLWQGYQVVTK